MATQVSVWIDHKEARVFHIHPDLSDPLRRAAVDETTVLAPQHHIHRHPKGRSGEAAGHPEDATHFFDAVSHTLAGADAILIIGPASAKLELFKYLRDHHPHIAHRVIGLETVAHPSGPEIVAMARKVFSTTDQAGHAPILTD